MKIKVFLTIATIFTTFAAAVAQPGALDLSFNPGNGTDNVVYKTLIQSDGKIIIAGWFSSFDGTNRNRIARINTDGTLDTTFNPGTGANNHIYTAAIQNDGKVIIGGAFTLFNGIAKNRIARLNVDGSIDTTFNIGTGFTGLVHIITTQNDGNILVGGDFASYNGTNRTRIARINTNGTLDASFNPGAGADGSVRSISVQGDGKIIIGGNFLTYNGFGASRIARINTDGSHDATFNSFTGANTYVLSTSIQNDGKIIIGGNFTSYKGTVANRIARLNVDGSLDTTFNIGTGASYFVYATTIQNDGKILIGGEFSSYNGTGRKGIARINTDGTLDTSFDPGTGAEIAGNSSVQTISIQIDEKIIIGGFFSSYDGTARNNIARILNSNTTDIDKHTQSDNVYIFPNPFTSQAALQTDRVMQNATLTIVNTLGQVVMKINSISGQSVSLQRNGLPAGQYFVRLTEDNKQIINKIIITD